MVLWYLHTEKMGKERLFSMTGKGTNRSNNLIKSDKSSSRKYTCTLKETSQVRLQCSFKMKYVLGSGTNTFSEDGCHLWLGKMITSITSDIQVCSPANPPAAMVQVWCIILRNASERSLYGKLAAPHSINMKCNGDSFDIP